ncbi:MAG: glutamine--fructose-6-phosphate transaminase (isomerizing) [Thermodesulfobacteriota bacterium]
MCGIVGYIGNENGAPFLLEGLKRLEYRGYDSAGIGYVHRGKIKIIKKKGRISMLEPYLPNPLKTRLGIAHTRWATHGGVTDENAHPHLSQEGKVALVHNGIIDNYTFLKTKLKKAGYRFLSETDSEVLVNLIEHQLKDDPEKAVREALKQVNGTYGLAILFRDFPDFLVGARLGSPLIVGIGQGEMFLASDANAVLGHTQQAVYLEDREIVVLSSEGYRATTLENKTVNKTVEEIDWKVEDLDKGDYPHYLLKEIFEQPEAVERAYGGGGRLLPDFGTAKLGGLNLTSQDLLSVRQVRIVGMGTAYYAAMIGAYLLEALARIPAAAENGSELSYRNPVVDKEDLFLVISQSGETADTLSAMREIQNRGGKILGICNVVGSSVARESQGGIYIHAGPEISVASTKAFTSQVTILLLLALLLGRKKHLSLAQGKDIIKELLAIPEKMRLVLSGAPVIKKMAEKYKKAENFLFLGRGINYPVALEGALKLKELSYIHAEGFAGGDIKHGPIALICPETPSIFLLAKGETEGRMIGNMQEIKARQGKVVVISNYEEPRLEGLADDIFLVPTTREEISPLLLTIPLQLFAYYMALALKRDIDKPRNLAKSVTVE